MTTTTRTPGRPPLPAEDVMTHRSVRIPDRLWARIPMPRQSWVRKVIEDQLMTEAPPTQAEIDAHDHPNQKEVDHG